MPPLSVLIKPASSLCNMSCDYCFYQDEASKRKQKSYGFMTESTLKNVIRRTMSRAELMVNYSWQGGEPTLRGIDFFKKALTFQKQYNKNCVQIHNALQTNGFALNDEWCDFFHENHFLIGVSIDGTPAIHNSLRHSTNGEKTYSQIEHSIHLLDKHQVDYNILTVVTPAVASDIASIYNTYQKRGWHYQQYIACLDPLEEERGKMSCSLIPSIYGQFLIDLFNLWFNDWKHNRQPVIRQFENYIALAAGYMAESCDQGGICSLQTVVEADGSVYPCDFYVLDDYCLGNFNKDNMDVICAKRKKIGFIERSLKLNPQCKKCSYYFLCRGGCQRNRDYNPSTGWYYNYFCESYKMFFDTCEKRILEIAAQLR